MNGVQVLAFGCRLNALEAEVIRRRAAEAGLRDAVIVNSCAVTAEAERQARQAIRKARRSRPSSRIVVTGCAAQLAPDRFAAMPEVDRVLGNREKLDAASYAGGPRIQAGATADRAPPPPLAASPEGRARAFVQIQQGCDHRCTFCIIPFARGPNRSVPATEIAREVAALVETGVREAVLTGVDITDYGADAGAGPRLGALVRGILDRAPGLARLRLSSLDPAEAAADAALLDAIADESRLMPHFHLSVQSGSDPVLRRMARRHRRADVAAFCAAVRARRPDAVFGADLIAGFPTETEAMFEETRALVDEAGLTFLHVFPCSVRPGTPAARMPQLPAGIRRARAALLREAGARRLDRFLASRRGMVERVLVEDGRAARTEQFARMELDRPAASGEILRARVVGRADGRLRGRLTG